MKKVFNTEKKALKHLEYRKRCAYYRIQKRGDKILGDASFIHKNHKGKWIVFVQIITDNMMQDIEEVQEMFDFIHPLIPFTSEEQIIKSEKRIKQLEKKYKTLDIESYTINKII
jgi:hypothetical protein